MDKIEDTIREIAVKHGIAVGRDDPILILHTINDRLMRESSEAQKEILDRFKEELETVAHRWGEDAKKMAERTLNAALMASKDAMSQAMQDGALASVQSVRKELATATDQIKKSMAATKRTALMVLAASSILTVFSVGLVAITVFR